MKLILTEFIILIATFSPVSATLMPESEESHMKLCAYGTDLLS